MTDKQRHGIESELLAEYYLTHNGYIVSKPINDFFEYDFVIDNQQGNLYKVQVKTIYFDNNKKRWISSCVTSHIRGNGRRGNKKYTEQSFDYGLFICKEYNLAYLIPISKLVGKRSITFYPNGKNNKSSTRYQDYEKYKDTII